MSNPYLSPSHLPPEFSRARTPNVPQNNIPPVAQVILIIDLVFCTLRFLIVAVSVLGLLFALGENDKTAAMWISLELVAGGVIALTGIPAGALLLMRKPLGIPLGWCACGAAIASILISIAEVFLWHIPSSNLTGLGGNNAQARMVGMIIGGGCVGAIRIGIVAAYIYAMFLVKPKLIRSS